MVRLPRALLFAPALAFLFAAGGPAPRPAAADDVPAAPADEERQEQIERHTTRGWAAFRKGNHDEALLRMERLEKLDPKSPVPRLIRARILARTGKYADALSAIATGAPGDAAGTSPPLDPSLRALRFELLRRLGRHDEAATAAAAAIAANPDDVVARTMRGLLLEDRGRRTEALAEYDAVVAAYNAKDPRPEELSWVAQAAIRATWLSTNPADDMLLGAQKVLKRRIEADETDVDALLVYADLLQSQRGQDSQKNAGKYYKQVLDANPEIAEARVGLAKVALVFGGDDQATTLCRRALATNPNLVPALNVLAKIHVGDGDYEKADEMWKRASAVDPTDKEARAVRAARLFITGDRAGFDAMAREVLAFDPTYGALWWITADLVGTRQRRFDVAADLSAKAIEIDPRDPEAYVQRGVDLMNLGREAEAKASFTKAIEVAKGYSHVLRDNFLRVLAVVEKFQEAKSKNFVLRQNVLEAAVMEPYLLPLLEDSWTALSKKYGFEVDGPVLVESFHRHDDFSARTLGVTNIPALGVCFGKVILLDGPYARGLGEFSWARTAWHEFAHVVTLQMSKGQVPRWLTEGLSVHEERARKPEWGRDMDRELFDRWKNGRLLKMSEINHAFRGPDVMFAYFQGGLIVDHVTATAGFEAIQRMLRRFADDVPTEKVFEEVLKTPLADFDARFATYVESLVGGYRMVPRWDDESKKEFQARVEKDEKDAVAWARLAWAHHQRGNTIDGGAALEKAIALTPDAPEVVLLQADRAAKAGLEDAARKLYRRFLDAGHDDLGARLWLAKVAVKGEKGYEEAVGHYEAAKRCFPRFVGRGNPYLELAKLHRGAGKTEEAVRELEAYARLSSEDYRVRAELAAWYEKKKDDGAVLRLSQEMVEINPFGANRSDPPDLDLHRRYAKALRRAGRNEEAAREWKVQLLLLRLVPEAEREEAGALEAHLELGTLLLELGRSEDAYEQASAALGVDPDSAAAKELRKKALEAGGLK
jgi:tetratricopeptide (TPR) repeat protein